MTQQNRNVFVFSLVAFAFALLPLGGCHKDDSLKTEGESHFLETCSSSCSGGLQCLCGVCTLPCDSSQSCRTLGSQATCGTGIGGVCGGSTANQNICQVSCKDSSACVSLGAGFVCEAGSCVRRTTPDASIPSPDAPAMSDAVVQTPLAPNKVDVLFMIDNSGSMAEEQDALRAAMPTFVTGLRNRFGAQLDLHVGFITSDVGAGSFFVAGNPACNRPGGDRGQLQALAGCGLVGSLFVTYSQQGLAKNFSGELSQVVGCLAQLGTMGCGFEHQLQSVRLALDPALTPANAGFVRPDARLMLVLLTDEDDCSGAADSALYVSDAYPGTLGSLRCSVEGHLCNGSKPPQTTFSTPLANCVANPNPAGLLSVSELVANVKARKPQGGIEVMVLAGVSAQGNTPPPYAFNVVVRQVSELEAEPACAASKGTATPALRLLAFADAFGGTVRSICEPSFDDSMTIIAAGRN